MSLFYLNEHTSCYNYSNFIEEGFRYYKFDKGINYEERLIKDCILFVLKGNLQFLYNEFEFTVSEGNMFFWSRDSLFNMYSSEESEVVVALFEGGISPCQKASFADLFHLKKIIKYHMESLVIRDELRKFLELLVCYLEDGANCIHFHETKLKELFWNIRFYYSREEQANFFYTIIGRSQDLRNKVLNNYKECSTVKELASLCGISLPAFKRQFIAEFGETPSKWMKMQLLGDIKYRLSVTDLSLGSIADEFDFASLAHFSRYCKRYLGCPPKEWREQINRRTEN